MLLEIILQLRAEPALRLSLLSFGARKDKYDGFIARALRFIAADEARGVEEGDFTAITSKKHREARESAGGFSN
jgi:hypothetical protein